MKQIWDVDELAEHWSLKFEETRLLKTKPDRNHLPFAVQLKFYQNTGRFPSTINEIPETPLHYLADQLDVDVSGFRDYEWSGRTGARHRKEILNFLGIRRVSATDKHAFSDWLVNTLYPHGSDPADATEAAFGWFQQRLVECPADKELERLVRSSFQQFELHLYQRCADSLSTDSKMLIEASLSNDADGVSFGDLKADPGRTGLESVLKEVEKLNFIRSLGDAANLLI
ncbi:DUF4158 domain-containing protein [Citrobacter freundii]|uniref:DUF4158 domain-containing protein n=1 Tax=Citrobacter freundii TaxID=546 RepID=UPI0008FD6098|nr:DUF4158 domain-containing protein [Citrobacter freundii]OIZ47317.1 hypothetical protein BEH70_26195 [Citrobacter freundii]TBV85504.1 DUF4158 domain-containing protein [Citrobacter freundii]TBV91164.1 DUF4158 domain-containing protein [Citrobacter freundii]TKI71513.1 DUF4158 domain-containing protein [Citrobacter freundii]